LREDGKLYSYEEERYDQIRKWFNDNLQKPTRFTASKPPFYRKKKKAISWFMNSAEQHIAHARSLIAILQNHGVSVQMPKTDCLGYVLYEDDHQIVAEPFIGQ
jgi:hypothetical protein